jgi:hypothetical protein
MILKHGKLFFLLLSLSKEQSLGDRVNDTIPPNNILQFHGGMAGLGSFQFIILQRKLATFINIMLQTKASNTIVSLFYYDCPLLEYCNHFILVFIICSSIYSLESLYLSLYNSLYFCCGLFET